MRAQAFEAFLVVALVFAFIALTSALPWSPGT